VDFYELRPWELSTTDELIARQRIQKGAMLLGKTTSKTLSLEYIYRTHPMTRPAILSIDVEGAELDVLESNDWNSYRPDIICVEELQNPITDSVIVNFLRQFDYSLVVYNGVSSIYVLDESPFLR
jgi:hypothetical protein